MSSPLSRLVRMLMLALVLGLATARPATAADEGPSILRDTETEYLFRDVAKPLIEAANLDEKSVKVVLLKDDEINAFVAGSQNVYVNSGLITRADNVNQLQFVIAHELGHVAGGHAIRMGEGAKEATGITLATMVLGAIAIAAGAGDAGLGLMMMGQQAALGEIPGFHARSGDQRRSRGRQLPPQGGDQRQGRPGLLQEAAEPGIPPRDLCDGQLRPDPPAFERARRNARQSVQEGSGLGQADRSGARGEVPASEGQAGRLHQPAASDQQISRDATRPFRRIMPAPTPITWGPIRKKRCRKPTRC